MAIILLLSILLLFLLPRGSHGKEEPWLQTMGDWKSPVYGVQPIPCHSHNDYLRSPPLYAALGTGCASVEVDVWYAGEELYVGHYEQERMRNATLSTVYIEPLKEILRTANSGRGDVAQQPQVGVFVAAPWLSLVLVINFKTSAAEAWPYANKALEPLRQRGWLAHWNGTHRVPGPVIVVGSGKLTFDVATANSTYRDIFLDAPLGSLGFKTDVDRESKFKYDSSNSHYASTKLDLTRGIIITWSNLKGKNIRKVRTQISQAKSRGLVPRYKGTPGRPRWFRKAIWTVLLREGVGVLNVDDLAAVRRLRWQLPWKGWPAASLQRSDGQ